MGCKEKRCAVEFGKGVGGFDDGVAKAFQNDLVKRFKDGVLKDDVLHVVFSTYRSRLAGGSRRGSILHSRFGRPYLVSRV